MEPTDDPVAPSARHEAHAATTYQAFLKDLERLAALPRDFAERAALAVLAALERRVVPGEARHLESQLPSKLRELLGHLRQQIGRQRRFGRTAFLRMVGEELGKDAAETELIARAVFRAVRQRISEGEARDLAAELPPDLAELWLNP